MTKKYSTIMLMLMFVLLFVSCEKIDLTGANDEGQKDVSGTKSYKVSVLTRAASAASDIRYPITVKAIDGEGNVAAEQQVTGAGTPISLSLREGDYVISAVSGDLTFARGFSHEPLLIGRGNVTVGNGSTSVNIVMAYAVASVDFSVGDIPAEVSAVSISLSPLYTAVTESGEYGGAGGTVTIPLQRGTDGKWQSGTTYVLPGSGDITSMSVSMTSAKGTEVYAITYGSPLKAASPYHFNGAFIPGASSEPDVPSSFEVSGTLSYAGWADAVSDSFSFGPTVTDGFNTGAADGGNATTYHVSKMPAQGSLWNGHIVAYVDGNDAILLSVKDWGQMTSALYEQDPTVAADIAKAYAEGDVTAWSIPTTDEARLLKSVWNTSTVPELNAVIASADGDAIELYEGTGNARYLCDAASHTFSFVTGSSVMAAGKTVKTYRLRLVKRVRYIVTP